MNEDLIRRSDVLNLSTCITKPSYDSPYYESVVYVEDIEEIPSIDAEPIRHGEWIVQKVDANQTKFYCSECERTVLCGNDYFMKPSEYVTKIYPYCHCGAKMDGGAE